MALSDEDQRERDWLAFYCLAEQYRREHGDLLVPNDYVCQGKRLGAWIGTQRMEYKSRTNPRFTQARVDLLNAIGMVWDVRQFQWNRMYQALERYLQKHGTARVPQSYVTEEGVKLGIWLNKVRMEYKRGRLSQARQAQLEALGVVWEPEVLRRESWEHFFALLEDYVVCNGTFPPATYQTEAGVKLGIWLSNQKQDRKNGALAPDRLQKLEALGVIWDVPEQAWMDRYRQAEAYFQCHGHLCPYQRRNAPLPAGLSQWLTAQRKAKQAGKLSPEKSRMLESVGMIWDVYQSLWETAYQQAEAYVQRHGHLRVSKDSGPDQFLGRWISTQRKNYKKGVLNEERTRKLETLGMVWDAGVDSEELWEQWFRKASAYYAAHGHLNPMEGELRTWVLAQRAAKKGKRGCLTEAQIQRLEGIGMVWEPLTDQWQEMYQHAKAYYQVHQMLNVPCNYSTETGVRLGHWIARQRRCYKNFLAGKEGQGIGTIGTMDCPAAPEISQRCRGGGARGTGTPKTQAGRDRNGMGPVLGTMVGEIPGGKDLLPGPWPSEPPCELCHGGGSQIGHVAVLPAAGHAGESQFPHDTGAEGAVGSDWNALDPPADESECPAAAIISELLPRKKPAVKLDRRFFLWMHLAFPCKCQRMCLDKSVSK